MQSSRISLDNEERNSDNFQQSLENDSLMGENDSFAEAVDSLMQTGSCASDQTTTNDTLNDLVNEIFDETDYVFPVSQETYDLCQTKPITVETISIQLDPDFNSVFDVCKHLQGKINTEKINKFNVFRSDIFQCCIRAMRRKTFSPFNKISVKFSDHEGTSEGAVDEGGPTRELFRLVLQYLKDSELFVGQENKHITLNIKCLEDKLYVEAGKLIALSLIHGGPGPHFISKTLFSLIAFGGEKVSPTLNDVEDEIRTIVAKLEQLENISEIQDFVISENIFSIAGCHSIRNLNEKSAVIEGKLS